MSAYYNEFDPKAAAWLRELIKENLIAPGEVDERSIEDVTPGDLKGFKQCHFFAGIGGWSLALRQAGWSDDRPVWTGSCPCQPFSAAGQRRGTDDERHLWPAFDWLIGESKPPVVFGEQVASPAGLAWLDIVSTDMEGKGYAFAPFDLSAASVGSPHIRQRLWFVAHPESGGRREFGSSLEPKPVRHVDGGRGSSSGMADSDGGNSGAEREQRGGEQRLVTKDGFTLVVDHADHRRSTLEKQRSEFGKPGPVNGGWAGADWIACRDGRWRPVEPGSFPLAYGLSERMGRLRGYGNAIVPEVAEALIRSFMEHEESQ